MNMVTFWYSCPKCKAYWGKDEPGSVLPHFLTIDPKRDCPKCGKKDIKPYKSGETPWNE
jgi:hypothetical protein